MPANLSFFTGNGLPVSQTAGSGLLFCGDAGFGQSIPVGSWQGRTYVSNGAGTTQGPEAPNVKYLNAGSGVLGQTGAGVALAAIPNQQGTLNIRFEYDTPVRVQNATLRIYDRSNINNPASGITTKVAQLIHPDPVQVANGSGDTSWRTPGGSGVVVPLANSPGVSGLYAGNGTNSLRQDARHDWYAAISCSPDSIGSKTQYGLWVQLEFLP